MNRRSTCSWDLIALGVPVLLLFAPHTLFAAMFGMPAANEVPLFYRALPGALLICAGLFGRWLRLANRRITARKSATQS
jgi:hypothetical protein